MLMKKPSYGLCRVQNGFSLMEMAIVLMIMGILMSGVLVSVSQTTLSARRTSALAQMRQIENALYGFAQSQGRLPCPALANGTGKEVPDGGGTCTVTHGFVPASTLGFDGTINEDGLLLDPWQNPYRYSLISVSSGWDAAANDPGNPDFSDKGAASVVGIQDFFSDGAIIDPVGMFRICSATACGANQILSDISLGVILTMGEDWASTTSASELDNANNSAALTGTVSGNQYFMNDDSDFISADYVEGTDGTLDQFDDQLVWLSPYVLFNRMVSAGKLP